MISWNYILIVALALLAFFFYKEWTRKKKAWLFARLLASMLAVGSLLWMAYPFVNNQPTAVKKLVILTNGFDKDSVNKFEKEHNNPAVFSKLPLQEYPNHKVGLIANWHEFLKQHASDSLYVFGNGFSKQELAQFNNHPIIFRAAEATPAVSHVYWKQLLEPGEQLVVQGTYDNSSTQSVTLLLQAFGAIKDSVSIAANARHPFELRTTPVHNGTATYSLLAVTGNDTLEREPVPVEIRPINALQLLIVSASPDFDNTYLKNHLSRLGYQVTIKTTTSTNKTDKQFLNTAVQPAVDKLTAAYLQKFDVLITDHETLQKISAAELSAIRAAVEQNGTGLLVKIDKENTGQFYSRFFPVKEMAKGTPLMLQLRHSAADSSKFNMKIIDPVSILRTTGSQSILQDEQANVYAAAHIYGVGRVVATTLYNSYSMALSGNTASYQQLWWWLLSKTAKKTNATEAWRTGSFFSYINQPVQLQVEQDTAKKAVINQTNMYLYPDTLLPFVWNGIYWPVKPGWQPSPSIRASFGNWYVYSNTDWQQLFNYHNRAATKAYEAQYPAATADENPVAVKSSVNVAGWLLFVFLAACTFLWVEQKTG